MLRLVVDSSLLASVGYDERARILDVELRSGHVYRYFDVPRATYDGLLAAESKGQYYNEQIRDVFAVEQLS